MPSPIVIEKHIVKLQIQNKIIIVSNSFNKIDDAQNYLNTFQDMLNNQTYQLLIDSITNSLQQY